MLSILIAAALSCGGAEVEIGPPTGTTVSPYLTGMNTIYTHESMDTWKDGKKVAALKEAGISCLRYPGGHVVSFWDWEFPFHSTYQNFWDPTYIKTLTAEKKVELEKKNGHHMLIDDYFTICAESGLEPVMGINMFQGYKFNRLEDSIAKAVRLVKYCNKQTPHVRYYFLDNEAGHRPERGNHVPTDDYIRLIPVYAKAIKRIQPDAQLIVNPIQWGRVKDMIKRSGEHFDIVDSHWYYNGWGTFHVQDWRKEETNYRFDKIMKEFAIWKQTTGNEHLKISVMEWNLGPSTGADTSTYLLEGLVQANMLMNFIDRDICMAACWPLMWAPPGSDKPGAFRNFFDPKTGEVSPSRYIFQWFSMAGNGALLDCRSPSNEGLHATAVRANDGKTILVYVLNKSTEGQDVTIGLETPVFSVSAKSFQKGNDVNGVVVNDIPAKAAGKTVSLRMSDTSMAFLNLRIH